MKKFLNLALIFLMMGCAASNYVYKPYVDPQYGLTKKQMIDLMGRPESIEVYKKTDETRVEFYIYVRRFQSSQLKVPVCLIDNKIVGWGKSYYEDHISADDVRIR